ncbi:Phosphate carrier protein, mitochondrial [Papilio machaon]|uniref:Phosphate carrier protein, mitochondrial n=1 Tax=Papilio machaon TaxID=76193 RepID=A0A194R5P6_PAPMA|nr:Phosphate carrier protein, mitochondrial [Papilio machaon]
MAVTAHCGADCRIVDFYLRQDKMFASLLEAARKSPFHGPLTPALCDTNEPAPALTESNVQPLQTIAASSEPEQTYSCEFGSAKYFALCGVGGLLSCGLTHTAVVPLDLVKCRLQVDPEKYKNVMNGFRLSVREEGVRSLAKGWTPTLIGYSLQGLFKFGLYEVFKVGYSDMLDAETAYVYRTFVYLAASASAEVFADIALSPFEAVKVRIQTMPGFANTMREAWPKMVQNEGYGTFYKGLVPLWGRQIPYTMIKFACFERTLEMFYKDKSATVGSIVSKLGWAGVWKGLGTRIVMIGTLTALQWFIFDGVKVCIM